MLALLLVVVLLEFLEVLLHDLVEVLVGRLVKVVNRKQVVTRVSVEEPLCAETPILHPYS